MEPLHILTAGCWPGLPVGLEATTLRCERVAMRVGASSVGSRVDARRALSSFRIGVKHGVHVSMLTASSSLEIWSMIKIAKSENSCAASCNSYTRVGGLPRGRHEVVMRSSCGAYSGAIMRPS